MVVFEKKKFGLFLLGLLVLAGLYYFRDSLAYKSEPDALGRGVTFYDRWRAQPGYNLVEVYSVPYGKPRCRLMDMQGQVVLTLPGANCELLQEGGFASNVDQALVKWGKNLKPIWKLENLIIRHDIYEDHKNSMIYFWHDAESKVRGDMPFSNSLELEGKRLIINELLGVKTGDGSIQFRWNAWDHLADLKKLIAPDKDTLTLTREAGETFEFSHFNSIEVLPPNDLETKYPMFQAGNILSSSTICGCLVIIDRDSGDVLWSYKTPFAPGTKENYRTHSVQWLASNKILFYKNSREDKDPNDRFAEVVEIDPVTKKIHWTYKAKTEGRFEGSYLGSVSRLENGNTLITSLSNGGNAFEVSRAGRLVWEWNNSVEAKVFPGSIYRVRRVSVDLAKALIAMRKPPTVGVADPFFNP